MVAQWDCTRRGAPKPLTRADGVSFTRLDQHGHGTHIAAIIASVRSTVAALSTRGVGGGSAGCGAERPHNNGAATISGDRS